MLMLIAWPLYAFTRYPRLDMFIFISYMRLYICCFIRFGARIRYASVEKRQVSIDKMHTIVKNEAKQQKKIVGEGQASSFSYRFNVIIGGLMYKFYFPILPYYTHE
jgi:hypothetical protein